MWGKGYFLNVKVDNEVVILICQFLDKIIQLF